MLELASCICFFISFGVSFSNGQNAATVLSDSSNKKLITGGFCLQTSGYGLAVVSSSLTTKRVCNDSFLRWPQLLVAVLHACTFLVLIILRLCNDAKTHVGDFVLLRVFQIFLYITHALTEAAIAVTWLHSLWKSGIGRCQIHRYQRDPGCTNCYFNRRAWLVYIPLTRPL